MGNKVSRQDREYISFEETQELYKIRMQQEYHRFDRILQDPHATPVQLTLDFLEYITSYFSEERVLGSGGFGVVYKGILPNGKETAVKRLRIHGTDQDDEKYQKELKNLTGLEHKNIVQFKGYCTYSSLVPWPQELQSLGRDQRLPLERRERVLCFEYVSNKSLREHISDVSCGLEWHVRYKLIMGICSGLHYLHTNRDIAHMDLKPENILLDDNMVPKIADFGTSRFFDQNVSRITTQNCVGSRGYMAPEYSNRGKISKKADIFSFGVIVLELLTGSKSDYPESKELYTQFTNHVVRNWSERLPNAHHSRQVHCCISIALNCVDAIRDKRPTTGEILKKLNEVKVLLSPPNEWSPSVLQDRPSSSWTAPKVAIGVGAVLLMIVFLLMNPGRWWSWVASPTATLLLAVAVSFSLILVSVYVFQLITDARRCLPPGPLPLPLVGNLLNINADSHHRSLARLAKRHGPLMSVRLGVVQAVVVSAADTAKQILVTYNLGLAGRPIVDAWRANGHIANSFIISQPDAKWRALRKLCLVELFLPAPLNATRPLRRQVVQELVRHVSEQAARGGEAFAVRDPAFTASMNMLSRAVFSTDLDSGLKDIVKEAAVLAMTPNVSDFFPAIAAADLQGLRRRMAPLVATAYRIIDRLFEQRVRAREAGEPRKNDMLDMVLDKEHEWKKEGSMIDRDAIKGLFTELFVAGSDSSSTTVEWAMAQLLQSPQVMNKVKAELREVLGMKMQVEESDIDNLPYLQAVVKEVLRLHPPVAMTYYRAHGTVQVNGYTIPQGTTIILNIWAVHRDAYTWEDPDKFKPERFMNTESDSSGKDFTLIPFGGGCRICPGLALAYRTVQLILASLLHQFQWSLPEDARSKGIDMTENFGIVVSLASPLKVIAKKGDI